MWMEISSWWTCRHTCFIHLPQFLNWTTIHGSLCRSEPILSKKATITILCCCLHNNQSHCSGPSFPLQWLAVSHTAASLPSCITPIVHHTAQLMSQIHQKKKAAVGWSNTITLRTPTDADPTNQKHQSQFYFYVTKKHKVTQLLKCLHQNGHEIKIKYTLCIHNYMVLYWSAYSDLSAGTNIFLHL